MNTSKTFIRSAQALVIIAGLALSIPVYAVENGTSTRGKLNLNATTSVKVRAELQDRKEENKENRDERKEDQTERKLQVMGTLRNNAVKKAVQEIDRRISNLNKLVSRISSIKRVSATAKTSLTTTVNTQISDLTALKAKIQTSADSTATSTLRADIASITKSYRIYALIIPQINILLTADRIITTSDMMATTSAKLQTKITEAQNAGKDVSSLNTQLATFNTERASAKVQAQAAIDLVVNLKPDQGSEATLQSNTAALKAAREKLRAGEKDLKDANTAAKAITKGLRAFNLNATSTTSVN